MNQEQRNAAKKAMVVWLSDPVEWGKAPYKIECVGELDRYDMHYYIFKFKKSFFGKWVFGIAGGYKGDELSNSGHTFSEMQVYRAATIEQDAIALVDYAYDFAKEQAIQAEERKRNPGNLVHDVLLKEAVWDKEALLQQLKEDWGIEDETTEEEQKAPKDLPNAFAIGYKGAVIAVAFIPSPIPNHEAEYYAQVNYRWPDAVKTVKQHKANLMVTVFRNQLPIQEAAILLVKTVTTCCKLDGALGVYGNGSVYQPDFYRNCAKMMNDDMFPVMNMVWFGMYGKEKDLSGYTYGMSALGFDEMEILNSDTTPDDMIETLLHICNYVIQNNVILKDGETFGFTPEQKFAITRSKGVSVSGETLKLEYKIEKPELNKFSQVLAYLQQVPTVTSLEESKELLKKCVDGSIEMDMQEEMLSELYYAVAHLMMKNFNNPEVNLSEAAEYLEKAIAIQDLEKYTLELYNVLASDRKREDGELDAIAAMEAFIKRTGGTPKVFATAGNLVLMYTDDLEKGVDYFHRAIEMEPDRVDTYWTYFTDLEEIVEEYPEYLEDAILCLTRIIELCSRPDCTKEMNIPNRYWDLAQMYYKAEKYQEALECVNHFLEAKPDGERQLKFRNELMGKIKN